MSEGGREVLVAQWRALSAMATWRSSRGSISEYAPRRVATGLLSTRTRARQDDVRCPAWLLGLTNPDAGEIDLLGHRPAAARARSISRRASCPGQVDNLDPAFHPVRENLLRRRTLLGSRSAAIAAR
jgi:hypothetical protein